MNVPASTGPRKASMIAALLSQNMQSCWNVLAQLRSFMLIVQCVAAALAQTQRLVGIKKEDVRAEVVEEVCESYCLGKRELQ